MPQFSLILAIGFFASLGLPGLNSFWSEFMVFLGTYGSASMASTRALVLVPMVSIVVTAAYYVYTMQRVLFGEPPKEFEHVHDLMPWERFSYVVLVVLIFAVGLLPFAFLTFIQTFTARSLPWLLGAL
jgi:NADH-quinone oxidoreductase subunit M